MTCEGPCVVKKLIERAAANAFEIVNSGHGDVYSTGDGSPMLKEVRPSAKYGSDVNCGDVRKDDMYKSVFLETEMCI